MTFPYFSDPENFAYVRNDSAPCAFCSSTANRLDGGLLYGDVDLDAVCFDCVRRGALIERDISTNSVNLDEVREALGDDAAETLTNIIVYCTPKLPSWQDTFWPFVDGDFATFVKIASKIDFADKHQFAESIIPDGISEPDPVWQWEMLPDHAITNIKEGQYDITTYLFRRDDRILTIWDAS